mgnify:CR=1 FL=1
MVVSCGEPTKVDTVSLTIPVERRISSSRAANSLRNVFQRNSKEVTRQSAYQLAGLSFRQSSTLWSCTISDGWRNS